MPFTSSPTNSNASSPRSHLSTSSTSTSSSAKAPRTLDNADPKLAARAYARAAHSEFKQPWQCGMKRDGRLPAHKMMPTHEISSLTRQAKFELDHAARGA